MTPETTGEQRVIAKICVGVRAAYAGLIAIDVPTAAIATDVETKCQGPTVWFEAETCAKDVPANARITACYIAITHGGTAGRVQAPRHERIGNTAAQGARVSTHRGAQVGAKFFGLIGARLSPLYVAARRVYRTDGVAT